MKILVLNGPNLNLLGTRDPAIYGRESLEDLQKTLEDLAEELGVEIDFRQSNLEGELVEWLQKSVGECEGIVFNPAAYSHTSVAIRDALAAIPTPCIEVHLSNVEAREDFRQVAMTAAECVGRISGLGFESYRLGLRAIIDYLSSPKR